MLLFFFLFACDNNDYTLDPNVEQQATWAPELTVEPTSLDFGAVLHDTTSTLPLTLSNTGNARLEVTSVAVEGSDSFLGSPTSLPLALAPGESATLDVVYAPHAENEAGDLVIATSDPGHPKTWVELAGTGLFPILDIRPNPYNFGEVPLGCTYYAELDMKNVGSADLEVTDVAHAGVGFELISKPVLPLTLAPGDKTSAMVAFTPPDLASFMGSLWVTTNDVSGTGYATQTATGANFTDFTDEFWQANGPWDATDIVFTVDQSGSMVDDQENLKSNFTQFTATLEDFIADWHIMVVTDDDGCLNEMILDPSVRHADEIFALAVQGPSGYDTEAGLTLGYRALTQTGKGDCNEGFLRTDAKTMLINVSDEPEQSAWSWEEMVASILEVAPNASISAIAGDVPAGCASAEPGTGYYEASVATGGAFLSICASDWGSKLRTLAWVTGAAPTDTSPLPSPPEDGTLRVFINDNEVYTYTFDASTNAVVFWGDAVPVPGSHIVATYGLGCGLL